jgi:hypothetical protein
MFSAKRVMIGAGMVAAAIVGWASLFEGNWGVDAFFLPALIGFFGALFLTSCAVSYAVLRRIGLRYWVISVAFPLLPVIMPLIKKNSVTGGIPSIGEYLFFLFVSVPILVGWLAGAAYQLGRSRYLRARRDN